MKDARKVEERKPDVREIKSTDGEDHEPSSLPGFSSRINRFLNEGKYLVSIIDKKQFDQARKCLEARKNNLKRNTKGS